MLSPHYKQRWDLNNFILIETVGLEGLSREEYTRIFSVGKFAFQSIPKGLLRDNSMPVLTASVISTEIF